MKNATTTMLQVDENPSRAVSESLSFCSLLSIQFAVPRRCDAIVSEEMGVLSANSSITDRGRLLNDSSPQRARQDGRMHQQAALLAPLHYLHADLHDDHPGSLCRNRSDGRGLLRELLHLVRNRTRRASSPARLRLPGHGNRARLPPARRRSELPLQIAGPL